MPLDLGGVPFLSGYRNRERQMQQEDLGQLQQAQGLMQILGQLQQQGQRQAAAQKAQAYEQAVQSLGPNPTQEALVGVAAKFGGPEAVMKTHQSSLDKKAALEAKALQDARHMEQKSQFEQMMHEYRMGRLTNEAEREAERKRHNEAMEGYQKQLLALRGEKVNVTIPPAVTPVTIQDPNDPNGTIIIDGRTRAVLGKGPKLTDVGKAGAKRDQQMEGLNQALQQAEDLLSGVRRTSDGQVIPGTKPTSSGLGSVIDAAGAFVGVSPPGANEAQELRVVGGVLTSKIPRFEGPQSDKDTLLYKQMAGEAANEGLPISRRLAAVKRMRMLYGQYEKGEGGKKLGQTPTAPPAQPAAPAAPNQVRVVDW